MHSKSSQSEKGLRKEKGGRSLLSLALASGHDGPGDSPRPPFLSVFVNEVCKLSLVNLVYHLFGGLPGSRVHPHIQRPIRLKTESSARFVN